MNAIITIAAFIFVAFCIYGIVTDVKKKNLALMQRNAQIMFYLNIVMAALFIFAGSFFFGACYIGLAVMVAFDVNKKAKAREQFKTEIDELLTRDNLTADEREQLMTLRRTKLGYKDDE